MLMLPPQSGSIQKYEIEICCIQAIIWENINSDRWADDGYWLEAGLKITGWQDGSSTHTNQKPYALQPFNLVNKYCRVLKNKMD